MMRPTFPYFPDSCHSRRSSSPPPLLSSVPSPTPTSSAPGPAPNVATLSTLPRLLPLRPLLHLLLLLLCGLITVVDGDVTYTGTCDGGGLALTPDLYTQGYEVYKEAVCVPDAAFCRSTTGNYCADSPGFSFSGDVNLTNMELLVYVGASAFNAFKGKLTISGSFPKWKEIRERGFRAAGTADSLVALDNATALEAVGEKAFSKFKGSVTAKGTYPDLGYNVCQILPGSGDVLAPGLALMPDLYNQGPAAYNDAVCIPDGAFCHSTNYCPGSPGLNFTGDVILENMEQLEYVGASAFRYFSGKVVMDGVFPKWKEVGESAFAFCGNSGSSVTLDGGGGGAADAAALEKVGADAFFGFAGMVIITGSFPAWTEIGAYAFYDAGTSDSMVEVRCRGDTWSVGTLAFAQFKGDHTTAQGEAYSCTSVPSSMAGGVGTVLVALFFGLAGGYWGLGFVYKALIEDATGTDRYLHYTFLSTIPGLTKTGIRFSYSYVASYGRNNAGGRYDEL